MKKIRYTLEAAVILFGVFFFRLFPLDVASALAGLATRGIGPLLRVHKIAVQNLIMAMPELSAEDRKHILRGMWDNLGRNIGEYPHLARRIMAKRITIEGMEYVNQIKASGKGAVFVSGHFANWEIIPLAGFVSGLPLVVIYRAPNNLLTDWVVRNIRASYSRSMHNKGREGAHEALRALKENHALAMLVDQKMNDGYPIPFFGHDAMTATAAAQLAIKYEVPMLVARIVRTQGVHFHVTIEPPYHLTSNDDPKKVMADVNAKFESWIREKPAQWFWVHNRWNKSSRQS